MTQNFLLFITPLVIATIMLRVGPLSCITYIDIFLDTWFGAVEQSNIFNQEDNFSPVDSEKIGMEISLTSGSLPSGLEGLFIRVGPNPILSHLNKKRLHWFGKPCDYLQLPKYLYKV